MNEEERELERRRRKTAGTAEIPSAQDGEQIRGLLTTETELRLLSDFGVYRVLLPKDVDPEITAKNVPWVLQKELPRGSRDPIIARTLAQLEEFKGNLFYDGDVQKMVTRHMVAAAKALSDCKDIIEEFRSDFDALPAQMVTRAGPSAVSVKTLDAYDRQCRAFFVFAKRVIVQCTALIIEGFNLRSKPGNVTALLKELDAIDDANLETVRTVLRHHEDWCKFITIVRNSVEHPKATEWLETRNCTLQPDGSIMRPSFWIHHPDIPSTGLIDFQSQAEAALEPMTAFCEDALAAVGLFRYKAPFQIEVGRLPEHEIDPILPTRVRAVLKPSFPGPASPKG